MSQQTVISIPDWAYSSVFSYMGAAYSLSQALSAYISPGQGATARATLMGGTVPGVTVTSGGQYYASPPLVTIVPADGNGSGAAAFATISGGVVTAITMSAPGSGYTGVPVVIIAAQGSGAAVSLNIEGGSVTSIDVTNSGNGYQAPPSIIFEMARGRQIRCRKYCAHSDDRGLHPGDKRRIGIWKRPRGRLHRWRWIFGGGHGGAHRRRGYIYQHNQCRHWIYISTDDIIYRRWRWCWRGSGGLPYGHICSIRGRHKRRIRDLSLPHDILGIRRSAGRRPERKRDRWHFRTRGQGSRREPDHKGRIRPGRRHDQGRKAHRTSGSGRAETPDTGRGGVFPRERINRQKIAVHRGP
jgi:hypothetical protein